MERGWKSTELERMLNHPVYVGMGGYPAIVEEELWLDANVSLMEEAGARRVVVGILARFRETFPALQTPDAGVFILRAQRQPRSALRQLLRELRELSCARALAGGDNRRGAR